MKLACTVGTVSLLLVLPSWTMADPSGDTMLPKSLATDPSLDPAVYDSDAVPQAVIQRSKEHPLTQDELEAQAKAIEDKKKEEDWLFLSYQQQLELRKQASSGFDPSSDNSADKTFKSSGDLTTSESLSTSMRPASDRKIAPAAATPTPAFSPSTPYKPLITPMGGTDAAGLHDFFSSATPNPVAAQIEAEQPAKSADSMMDVPGLSAQQQGLPPEDTELKLNLPGEVPDKKDDMDRFTLKALPLTDPREIIRQQDDLSMKKTFTPDQKTVAKNTPIPPPQPIVLPPTQLHMHIADPREFFQR